MDRNDKRFGRQCPLAETRRPHQRNMFALHLCLHHLCIIQAKHAVRVIDEHVEVLQKVPPKNPADVRIGCLKAVKVLYDNQSVSYGMRTRLEKIQMRKRRSGPETDADEPCRALNPKAKFGGQRRIYGGDLGTCIDQKVIRASVVDQVPRSPP